MLRFVARRLLQLVPTLLILSVLLFAWLRSLPGRAGGGAAGGQGDPGVDRRAEPDARAGPADPASSTCATWAAR